jgi:signal transduction histidine kinase
VALLNDMPQAVRIPRGPLPGEWASHLDASASAGWLAAPLTGRDGRRSGSCTWSTSGRRLLSEDESILTQLAQMSSISIENAINAEAREANRMKDEFLTTLSHELRTPLSAILGWTPSHRSERPGAPKLREGLEVIERNVMAQAKLIDDLLDVSRIITGKLRLQLRPVRALRGHRRRDERDAPAAESKKIRMDFRNLLAADEDRILGDPGPAPADHLEPRLELDQVHSPGGEVAVALSRSTGSSRSRSATPAWA